MVLKRLFDVNSDLKVWSSYVCAGAVDCSKVHKQKWRL